MVSNVKKEMKVVCFFCGHVYFKWQDAVTSKDTIIVIFSLIKKTKMQGWPCHKMGQGQSGFGHET